ncbi:MAG TPA: AAA family ATPase, partial [Steroidobacteraceae bacterium]|nr:AAA family ATPase [Steroidobacteraceae bacterium]
YLGLSTIRRDASGAISIDTEVHGPIVEYAVRLRQFDRTQELDGLVEGGTVDAELLREFGRNVADAHASAATAHEPHHGTPDAIRSIVAGNVEELQAADLSADESAIVNRVARRLVTLGQALHETMLGRRESSCVRECHGDLHAGNVVKIDDRLVAFDCIEFDPALRFIDRLCDAAFLYMDLRARRRNDLAYGFLDGWLERTGDYAGLPLLPYYSAYRALVRAKVMHLTQRCGASASRRPAPGVTPRAYLELAGELLDGPTPVLIVMMGLSGSGKTWISERLIAALPAVRVRSDVERKRLAGLAADASSRSTVGAGLYSLEFNERTYARLAECAAQSLRGGENVIVDAAFLKRSERDAMDLLATGAGATCVIVSCVAPTDVLRDRIRRRASAGNDASEATLDVLDRQLGYLEPLGTGEGHTITVETTAADAVQQVLGGIAGLRTQAADQVIAP